METEQLCAEWLLDKGRNRKKLKTSRIQCKQMHSIPKLIGHNESGDKRKVCSTERLHKEIEEISY